MAHFSKDIYQLKLDWRANHNKSQREANPFNDETDDFLDELLDSIKDILKGENKNDYTVLDDYISEEENDVLIGLFQYAYYKDINKNDIPTKDIPVLNGIKMIEKLKKSKIPYLSEEGHNAISEIHSMRHSIHINQEALFNVGSSDHRKFNKFLENGIFELMSEIPNVKYDDFFDEYHAIDLDDYTDEEGDYQYELQEEAFNEFIKMMNNVNASIRKYIEDVNEKFGTKY